MFQNHKPRTSSNVIQTVTNGLTTGNKFKRAAVGAGLALAVMAGTHAVGNELHPAPAVAYCGPGPCAGVDPAGFWALPGVGSANPSVDPAGFWALPGVGSASTRSAQAVIDKMSGPGYRPVGVTPAQWTAFKKANFMRLGDPIADRFAGRLWAAATLTPAERAVVQKDGGTKGQALSVAKAYDYRAVVDEIERATGYAWRIAPMMWRDNQRVVAEAVVAELRKSFSLEALSYGGVGLEPASVDGTYGNVVARAYAPGGVMFSAGDASLSIDANARAGAVR